jgi:hypothetical protein
MRVRCAPVPRYDVSAPRKSRRVYHRRSPDLHLAPPPTAG